MTMPHIALIECPPRAISYTMVRAAFDRALEATNAWPVHAKADLDRGDSTWLPESTKDRYIAHGPVTVFYTQHQDGGVDFRAVKA